MFLNRIACSRHTHGRDGMENYEVTERCDRTIIIIISSNYRITVSTDYRAENDSLFMSHSADGRYIQIEQLDIGHWLCLCMQA